MNTSTRTAMLLGSFMALLASKSVLAHDFESHPPSASEDAAPPVAPLAPVPPASETPPQAAEAPVAPVAPVAPAPPAEAPPAAPEPLKG